MAKMNTILNENKIRTVTRKKISTINTISLIFLITGVFLLIASIMLVSSIFAFLSLGLLLWGSILLYVRAQEYAPKTLLHASLVPSLDIISQLLEEVGFEGVPIYLPPTYFDNSETIKIHMLKKEEEKPSRKIILENTENSPSNSTSSSILLTPLGIELMKLFESNLNKNLDQLQLDFLFQALPKLLIQDLELAKEVKINIEDNQVKVSITQSVFQNMHSQDFPHSPVISRIGCPLCSAIACAMTKTTQKPLFIKKIQQSEDTKIINVTFETLDKIRPEVVFAKDKNKNLIIEPVTILPKVRQPLMPFLSIIFLIGLGSILLIPVAWTTYIDVTLWNKSILQALLESRTGEALSLGIGMSLIHYLVISFSFLLSGTLIYFRRKKII